jgi:hypothetical protein
MLLDAHGHFAAPHERSTCPSCAGELHAKCGRIVTWHWAHVVDDCDPWSEPETEWHRRWKRYLRDTRGAQIEVVMPPHRADVVLPDGRIVELQAHYLSAEQIEERERFYGPRLHWIYRCTWAGRLHFGPRGFWWKRGSKSMVLHRRPLWWHDEEDGEVSRVHLGLSDGGRVLGTMLDRWHAWCGEPGRRWRAL